MVRGIRRAGALSAVTALILSATGLQVSIALAALPPAAPQPAGEAGVISPAVDSPSTAQLATRTDRGARTRQRANAAAISAAPAAAAAAITAMPANAQRQGRVLANFDGTSSLDSAITNFGAEFEPPDQGLCAGNGFVVEMVNSAYTVYDTSGKVIAGPFNVNGPFEEGLTEFTSDPRCHYDAATHAWFATILAINKEETESFVDVAVNTSGDPTRAWTNYKINTTDDGGKTGPHHRGCPCLGDQPTLGIDAHNLYVTTNEFALASEQFNGAQVYAFAKKDLVGLKPAVHFVHFDKLTIGGGIAASVQPALTSGTPTAEYFLSALDPTETGDQRIGVWALSRGQLVAKGEVPELSSVVLPSEAYSDNPGAEQKGSSSAIDPGDDRMQQTQFSDGSVWGELGSAINIGGDGTQRAGAAWFQVEPILHKGILDGAAMQRQGYVAMPGNYVLYPALQLTPNGTAAMVMTLTGPKRFPSAAYATLAPGASTFGPITVAAPGSTNYDPNAERWGDYSWAVMDPGGASVWMATEYIPPKASQTPDGRRNWGTRVLDLSTGG